MPIEVVSHPPDLRQWHDRGEPFYLEVYGETRPLVNTEYAEVIPAGKAAGDAATKADAPVYEYWWTIGHPGAAGDVAHTVFGHPLDFWDNLEDPACRVFMYFPIDQGWRIKELTATVKYLSPTHHEKSFLEQAKDTWSLVEPLVADAKALADVAPVPAPAAAGVKKAATILEGLTKLSINAVPQADGYRWSAGKVTFGSDLGVMQGVMWTLPPNMFTELGGRLTGSIALSFIPAVAQQPGTVAEATPEPQPGDVLAHAVIYGASESRIWSPGDPDSHEFLRLRIHPQLPKAG